MIFEVVSISVDLSWIFMPAWLHVGIIFRLMGRLGGVLGAFWGSLGASWGRLGVLGRLGNVLRRSWGRLGAFWGRLGNALESWVVLGAS